MRRLTNEIIDERIKNRPLIRIGDCVNSSTKINWKCLKSDCRYEWKAKPNTILTNKGCPKCGGKLKLTEYDVDERMRLKKIQRLSEYINVHTKVLWKCLVEGCNYEWKSTPNSVSKSGCPKCSGNARLTNDVVDERINGRNIERVGNCVNSYTKIKFRCLVEGCNYEWKATLSNIFNNGNGCPRCGKRERITNEIVDERINGRPLIRVGECLGTDKKIKFRCLVDSCNHEWKATPSNIFNNGTGCPLCLKKSEKRVKELLETLYNNVDYQYKIKIKNKRYIVDFKINNVFIEYNGIQHYEPIKHFGGDNKFKKQQERDQILREYCKENNIRLIEIPYWLKEEQQLQLLQGL